LDVLENQFRTEEAAIKALLLISQVFFVVFVSGALPKNDILLNIVK
jgi:hypothetical protein